MTSHDLKIVTPIRLEPNISKTAGDANHRLNNSSSPVLTATHHSSGSLA